MVKMVMLGAISDASISHVAYTIHTVIIKNMPIQFYNILNVFAGIFHTLDIHPHVHMYIYIYICVYQDKYVYIYICIDL